MDFYSASLLIKVLKPDRPPRRRHRHLRSVIVVRARDFRDAHRRALAVGRTMECAYENTDGDRVRWCFVGVETIARLGRSIDHKEVWWELFARVDAEPTRGTTRFHPERWQPVFSDERVSGSLKQPPSRPKLAPKRPAASSPAPRP